MSTYHLLKRDRITNVFHVYTNIMLLHELGWLWHMDDCPYENFPELPKGVKAHLAQIQDEAWEVCQRDGICIHGVCLDIIKTVEQ